MNPDDQHTNAFTQPGRWYRGNLHTHTTLSDGERSTDQVLDWYRERGYHFVALTDHRVVSTFRRFDDGFLVLSGSELDGIDPRAGLVHLIAFGFQRAPDLSIYSGVAAHAEVTVDVNRLIRDLRSAGAIVFLAHPYWSGELSRDLIEMRGIAGIEVWNGSCEAWDCKGHSAVHWDDLLSADRHLWGLATDDCHWQAGRSDAGLGWVWVKAPELNEESIVEALRLGHFYSSSGPEIHDLRLEADSIYVRCSPVTHIDIVGNGPVCHRILPSPPGTELTEACYSLQSRHISRLNQLRYVRVACHDAKGGCAWSNPFYLGDPSERIEP